MAGTSKGPKKKDRTPEEAPVDLAARIGSRAGEPAVIPPPSSPPPPAEPVAPADAGARGRPTSIGGDEPARAAPPRADAADGDPKSAPILSVRGAPAQGEIDLVVTPLPTPDDWHRFEVALRRVPGVTQLRPEYYRHGVAKMRVAWEGADRLAGALRAGMPGYRIRVLGEDRATLQILVSTGGDERRPG